MVVADGRRRWSWIRIAWNPVEANVDQDRSALRFRKLASFAGNRKSSSVLVISRSPGLFEWAMGMLSHRYEYNEEFWYIYLLLWQRTTPLPTRVVSLQAVTSHSRLIMQVLSFSASHASYWQVVLLTRVWCSFHFTSSSRPLRKVPDPPRGLNASKHKAPWQFFKNEY
jgi:hypothetical protein